MPATRLKQPFDVSDLNGKTSFDDSPAQPIVSPSKTIVRPMAKAPTRPARALQQQLHQAFEVEPAQPVTGSWPGAAKVLMLLGSSALLWAGVIAVWRVALG